MIVRSVVNEGYQHDIEQRVVGIPLRPETAQILTEMLARSWKLNRPMLWSPVIAWLAKPVRRKSQPPRATLPTQTNASFVGWGPVDDPRFLVYVWLEKPIYISLGFGCGVAAVPPGS